MTTNANRVQIPVGFETETFNLSIFPQPAKILQFPEQVDQFLGTCESCGLSVYDGDKHRFEPSLTCSTCLAEELTWKKPCCDRIAA